MYILPLLLLLISLYMFLFISYVIYGFVAYYYMLLICLCVFEWGETMTAYCKSWGVYFAELRVIFCCGKILWWILCWNERNEKKLTKSIREWSCRTLLNYFLKAGSSEVTNEFVVLALGILILQVMQAQDQAWLSYPSFGSPIFSLGVINYDIDGVTFRFPP